jgi:c-di-GMP-binding flagellar brake protein YcgR
LNDDGEIEKEDGMSLDISAGGAAIYLNRRFDIGEVCELSFPRIGTAPEGRAIDNVIAAICWCRETPKGSLYRNLCGLQFRFADSSERERLQSYVLNVKKKYKL